MQNYKKEKKIFFKFNIFSYKRNFNLNKLDHKDFGVFNKKIFFNTVSSDVSTLNTILDNVNFMKSTSEHVNTGILYLKSFKINKNRIQNLEVYKYIIKNFK
mgnify:CR=1 FL=1